MAPLPADAGNHAPSWRDALQGHVPPHRAVLTAVIPDQPRAGWRRSDHTSGSPPSRRRTASVGAPQRADAIPIQRDGFTYGAFSQMAPRTLLPNDGIDLAKETVIACDQYASEPEDGDCVEAAARDAPPMPRPTYPEVHLPQEEDSEFINAALKETTEFRDGCAFIFHEHASQTLAAPGIFWSGTGLAKTRGRSPWPPATAATRLPPPRRTRRSSIQAWRAPRSASGRTRFR